MSTLVKNDSTSVAERSLALSGLSDTRLQLETARTAYKHDYDGRRRVTEMSLLIKGKDGATISMGLHDLHRTGEKTLVEQADENILRPSRDAGDRYRVELPVVRRGRLLVANTIGVTLPAAMIRFTNLAYACANDAHPFKHVPELANLTPIEGRGPTCSLEPIDALLHAATEGDAVSLTLGGDAGLTVSAIDSLGALPIEATA